MMARLLLSAATAGVLLLPLASVPTSANMAGMTQAALPADADPFVTQIQHRRGSVHVNRNVGRVNVNRNVGRVNVNRNVYVNRNINRNIAVNRNLAVNRGLYRGRHYWYGGGPWVRPRNYWWPVGGAIAAGAAIGVIAASSAAWAGTPPGPNYCWYYTDPSMRAGFWDVCQ